MQVKFWVLTIFQLSNSPTSRSSFPGRQIGMMFGLNWTFLSIRTRARSFSYVKKLYLGWTTFLLIWKRGRKKAFFWNDRCSFEGKTAKVSSCQIQGSCCCFWHFFKPFVVAKTGNSEEKDLEFLLSRRSSKNNKDIFSSIWLSACGGFSPSQSTA